MSERINFRDRKKVKTWLNDIIESEGFIQKRVSIIITNDDELLDLNKEFLNKDYLTDVITFDYSEGREIAGDVFISAERVFENARLFSATINKELLRVMAHGILHLMGYNDKTESEKMEMSEKEDYYLNLFFPGS
jgi:probable rRNA maturation factor